MLFVNLTWIFAPLAFIEPRGHFLAKFTGVGKEEWLEQPRRCHVIHFRIRFTCTNNSYFTELNRNFNWNFRFLVFLALNPGYCDSPASLSMPLSHTNSARLAKGGVLEVSSRNIQPVSTEEQILIVRLSITIIQ